GLHGHRDPGGGSARRGFHVDLRRRGVFLPGRAGAIDDDVLAVLHQRRDLLVVLDDKALEHERRLGPGPVELGHEHADLQFGRVDLRDHGVTNVRIRAILTATPSEPANYDRYARKPRSEAGKRPRLGKMAAMPGSPTPNQRARVAPYWST